ncbi:MAG: hypothetical protein V3S64_02045 [bacterium]
MPHSPLGPAIRALACCIVLTALTVNFNSARGEDRVEMSLYSLETEKLLYRGKRTFKREGGRVTEISTFTTPAGKPIQKTVAVFLESDLSPVRYQLDDLRSGHQEILRREKNGFFMSFLEKRGDKPDQDTEKFRPGSLIASAVVPRIQREWKTLMRGKKIPFSLLVPSRQDSVSFRVQLDRKKTAANKSRTVIRMDPDSWVIRQLDSALYFYFESKPPYRLLEYRGRFSIKTEDGDDQDLRITYHYLKEDR